MTRTKIYSFTRLIKKYTIPFSLQLFDDNVNGVEYDDLGKKVIPTPTVPFDAEGALIPPTHRQIYESGGRLTSSDRLLYIHTNQISGLEELPPKTRLFNKGKTYFVESRSDYEDFGDFQSYVLRSVNSFG